VDGKLSDAARRGGELFRGKANCALCHKGELRTDQKPHDIGTRGEFDRPDDEFYTPKLELYRTAPYLHDGRAATLKEVLTVHDSKRRHGSSSKLTSQELEDLIEYLSSL
jgi:cytochrome c peroxidase